MPPTPPGVGVSINVGGTIVSVTGVGVGVPTSGIGAIADSTGVVVVAVGVGVCVSVAVAVAVSVGGVIVSLVGYNVAGSKIGVVTIIETRGLGSVGSGSSPLPPKIRKDPMTTTPISSASRAYCHLRSEGGPTGGVYVGPTGWGYRSV